MIHSKNMSEWTKNRILKDNLLISLEQRLMKTLNVVSKL